MSGINITKLQSGKSCDFPGAEYNENKVENHSADLVFMGNVDEGFQRKIEFLHQNGTNGKHEVEQYLKDHSIACNTRSKHWQFHVAASVKGRELSAEQLRDFAEKFMEEIGYGDQPYFVYFHHDTDNNHVHILSTRITERGYAIADHHDIAKMNRAVNYLLRDDEAKELNSILNYRFTTLGQLANIVRTFGYQPDTCDESKENYTFYRNGTRLAQLTMKDILKRMEDNKANIGFTELFATGRRQELRIP